MHAQHHVLAFHARSHFARFSQNFTDHRLYALDVARAIAMRAGRAEGPFQRLLYALAGDRHQAKIVELEDLIRRPIDAHGFLEHLHYLLPVLTLVHVDKVDHNDAAEIAQTNLPHDFLDRLGVRLDDGVFQPIRFANVLPGIDV